MAKDQDIFDEELSEADRLLHKLYDKSKTPIDWDASDDAVLAMSRQITLPEAEPEQDADLGANVVRFPARNIVRRIVQSPGVGVALAASVMVGIFAGQGLTPYVNLGVAPDYSTILAENDRLNREMNDLTVMRTRNIDVIEGDDTNGPTAQDAAAGPGLASLAAVLGQFECAALSATLEESSQLVVTGHVSSAGDLDRLSRDLTNFGQAAAIVNRANVYAWPHCEAAEILRGFTQVGGGAGVGPTVRPFEHGQTYRQGENMVIEATAPADAASFIYVDFVQQDGNVIHLSPSDVGPDGQLAAGARLVLGQGAPRYRVEPPFGTEMVMVLSSPIALFDEARPQVEPAQEYLGALRAALNAARDAGYGAALRSDFSFLLTEAGN